MACLDTTVLIDLAGGNVQKRRQAFDKLSELLAQGESIVTTRFNVAELYVGVSRSANPQAEQNVVDNLLKNIEILEFDKRGAWMFGQITAYLQMIGKPAGDMDVLIASTAMAAGHSIVTRNKAHFINIPELTVEGY